MKAPNPPCTRAPSVSHSSGVSAWPADMIKKPPTTPRMATQAVSFIGAVSVIAAGTECVLLIPRGDLDLPAPVRRWQAIVIPAPSSTEGDEALRNAGSP